MCFVSITKKIIIVISSSLLFISCKQLPSFNSKEDLLGDWHCKTIEITSASHNSVNFVIRKYGFADLSFDEDSSYSFSMEIFQDVVIDKNLFGGTYSKTVLNSGYKNYRLGYYQATDSSITFMDVNRIEIKNEDYFFNKRTLFTKFSDKDNKLWKISWVKDN